MALDESLQRALTDLKFTEPTPIQDKVIPFLLDDKKDLIALAQTGTGKTAAFGLPLLQMTDLENKNVQSFILSPTRELCIQIAKDLESFSKYKEDLRVVPVYGGAPIDVQIRKLKKGAHVVVGTPGRVLDLIKRRALKINGIKWLVLDEADEMLNMGFKEDLDSILESTPAEKQTLLFSATMPKEIQRIANNYMDQPDEISVGKKNAGAENVTHEYYVSHARNRYEVLKRVADMNPAIYGIVFCRTRQETKEVADKFMNDGYNADALHGDLSQVQRDLVMQRFRSRHLQMLVATDVAARGLDVNDLTHVINYNLPDDLEIYIHRSGRTGRAGKSGTSISIVHTRETNKIKSLQKIANKKFERKMIPGGKEICNKQLFNLVDRVERVEINEEQINELLPEIYKKLEWLNREELIKHFVSVEFNRFLSYYKDAPDLNVDVSAGSDDRKREKRRSDKAFSRFFINVGSKNNLNPAGLMDLVNSQTSNRDIEIGKIDIMKKFSFFEVDKNYEADILKVFRKDVMYEDIRVIVDISKPEPNYPSSGPKEKSGSRPSRSKPRRRSEISYGDRFGKKSGRKSKRR